MSGKAVITGASGFVGRLLSRRLEDRGYRVTRVVRPGGSKVSDAAVYEADIRRPGALNTVLDDGVTLFHMAAQADIRKSVDRPRADYEVNLSGFFEVLESARQCHARIVFPSTGSVFDRTSPLPLSEMSRMRPNSPYAAAKLAGEAYCSAYWRSYGLDTRVARIFSIYGEGLQRFAVYDLTRKIMQNPQRVELRGDGMQIRDYLHIEDVAEGLITIAENGRPGEDYNLASGVPVRIADLATEIGHLLGYSDLALMPDGEIPQGENPAWYADITKIRDIGFKPRIALSEGLRNTVRWIQKQSEAA